nr:putative reverse transcriptase domain, aspartic peptidase domain protein [Tanacetum cinerariifolium]
ILHERDDDDAERPDKRQKSGDRHPPTTQQSSHRNHGHNNDRHGSDRQGGGDNHRSSNNNYSGNNNRNSGNGRDQRNRGFQQSRGPSEGYSYPVCTTCGRRHPGEYRRAAGTCFKCGQTGHLQKDCKKTPLRVHLVRLIKSQVHRVAFSPSLRIMLLRLQIISSLQARTLLSHGCEGFLATIHDITFDVPSIHDQPIVSEFLDVFPDELPGIPLVREVEFSIELIPGAEPISKAPYRMAPIELKELKDQLQELFVEGFSRLALPLTKLMRKGEKFVLNDEREKSFEELKQRLVSAPVLTLPSGMIAGIKVEEEIIRDLERLDIKIYVHGQHGYWASMRIEPDLISR